MLTELNSRNPQVASRLIEPLIRLKRYDAKRQALMRAALVRKLLNHRSFSMNNPNRIRSLIGAFAGSNPAAFHAEDGSGYQFLVEMLTELNSRNPQVASRLIEPLIRLKRYDAKRQALMRAALEQLKGLENLSGDLYEKIAKALA
jgi:aminopeptidase N